MGKPEPSLEIQRRLRAVHPDLHLRYISSDDSFWSICVDWEQSDERRERIREGTYDPTKAFDIVGYLPLNCSTDEAPAYLERTLRAYPKENIQRMADFIDKGNNAPVEAALEEALAEVLDRADPSATVEKRGRGRPRKIA
jgi:hypothetical protein